MMSVSRHYNGIREIFSSRGSLATSLLLEKNDIVVERNLNNKIALCLSPASFFYHISFEKESFAVKAI
jgi:hypothetical protein